MTVDGLRQYDGIGGAGAIVLAQSALASKLDCHTANENIRSLKSIDLQHCP